VSFCPPDAAAATIDEKADNRSKEAAMTTQPGPTPSPRKAPTVDEIFARAKAVDSIDELAQDGIFEDDAELDDFLTDLRRMRRSSIA